MGKTINEMRCYISSCYPGMKWKTRVKNMSTANVIVVYKKFTREGRKPIEPDPNYHQINMFEYLYSINEGKETHTEVDT